MRKKVCCISALTIINRVNIIITFNCHHLLSLMICVLSASQILNACVFYWWLEHRGCTSILGATPEYGRQDHRVFSLSGCAQHRIRTKAWHTCSAGVRPSILWAQPLMCGQQYKFGLSTHWLHYQASHHLSHSCTQWERLWACHTSQMASR